MYQIPSANQTVVIIKRLPHAMLARSILFLCNTIHSLNQLPQSVTKNRTPYTNHASFACNQKLGTETIQCIAVPSLAIRNLVCVYKPVLNCIILNCIKLNRKCVIKSECSAERRNVRWLFSIYGAGAGFSGRCLS
jgi:hypothetical protein